MEAIQYLTGIALILLIGIIASIFAGRLKTSNILFLVFAGVIIGNTQLQELSIFQFPTEFLISIAILTLAIIVFDGSSKFNLKELDTLSFKGLEVTMLFMLFNIITVTTALNFFFYGFTAQGIIYGIVLAILLSGTDPASVFMMLGDTPNKVLQFLKIEALINTPIMVLLPFLFLELNVGDELFSTFLDFLSPLLMQIIVGIGSGVLVGVIVFKIMKRWYSESLSPLAVISSTLLAYILAENLGGNGVLSVAVLGLLFGNTYMQKKGSLLEFSTITAYSLQILVFVFIGTIVTFPTELNFWLASIAILAASLLARFAVISAILDYKLREKVFMALNMPKGIAVAVVALTLALSQIENFEPIINLTIVILVYSLILSSVTTHFSKYFLKQKIEQ